MTLPRAHPERRNTVGISGFAVYLPCYRVNLEDWCQWTGDIWDKVASVVGRSFRMRAPNENAYTMAATAVMRLIQRYDIDPRRVGYLALGTESSTDNSVGAVIVKGMVDDALRSLGSPALARHCEVPEFKHACLGGVYAIKGAARYVALDGAGKLAIVVCADTAEYARGSSGEATQGAGAVAMLIEAAPRLLELDLLRTGSASDYRGADFRKPFTRFVGQTPSRHGQLRDFPVFNGKYSTSCYVDETLLAIGDMFAKDLAAAQSPAVRWRQLAAVFLHRPYRRMAETGLGASYLLALTHGGTAEHTELATLATAAGVDPAALAAELCTRPHLADPCRAPGGPDEPFPLIVATLRASRQQRDYQSAVLDKLCLGDAAMRECGNLYTASLPCWLAAGLEDAIDSDTPLDGAAILAIGYGSGDAAEAIPMRVVDGWQHAARRVGVRAALEGHIDLDRARYERLHDTLEIDDPGPSRKGTFVIDRIGAKTEGIDDRGVEYYRFVR